MAFIEEPTFDAAARKSTKPEKLTYESVVAALPSPKKPIDIAAKPTPLKKAAHEGNLEFLKSHFNESRNSLKTATDLMVIAAEMGHLPIVRYFFEKKGKKANIRARNNGALRLASAHGRIEIVRYLLEKDGEKADIHAGDDDALRNAAANGHFEIVRYLLEKDGEKADIHVTNNNALRNAAANGHLEVVRYLLEKDGEKADIHAGDDDALRNAAANGHFEIVRYLLEKDGEKANINAKDGAILIEAAQKNKLNIVRYLLEKEGEKAKISGRIFLELNPRNNIEAILLLLEHGVSEDKIIFQHHLMDIRKGKEWNKNWRKLARCSPPLGLLKMDPTGINLAALESCASMIRHEGYEEKEANLYAYQAVRLFGNEQNVLHYLKRWGTPGKQPLHDVVHMIQCPRQIISNDTPPKWDRKAWADAVMAQGPKMAKLVKFAAKRLPDGKLLLPVRSPSGKVSLYRTMEAASQFAYENAPKSPGLATLCLRLNLSEDAFELGLQTIRRTPKDLVKDIPDITIDGDVFGMPGARFQKLPTYDLRGLLLGAYTDCCQHLDGAGDDCACYGHRSPHSGFYIVTDEKDNIIGQSWAWRGEKGELVLDSLETLGTRVSDYSWQKLIDIFAEELHTNPGTVTALHIGTGGGTPNNMGLGKASPPAEPIDYDGYRDSYSQYCVASFEPKPQPMPKPTRTRKNVLSPATLA